MNKDKKMLFGIGLVFLFLATVSFTYAYFTATIVNKDVKEQVVQTGTLELTYTDGPEIIMNNIKPGATITKEISVKNTGTLNTSYNLVWQELANEIIKDEMVIEATCTRLNANGVEEGTCESLSSTPIKRIKVKENVSIEPNITHKYNITITFKETNEDQNYNQGKNFTGVLGINEYVENTPIYCTFDGELTQGTEYVNGQYTYRYKQKANLKYDSSTSTYVDTWNNITIDGWGVMLTDKTSTDGVNSLLCTYINGKPIVSMSSMFRKSKASNINLNSFDTSNVTDMEYMFSLSNAATIDISGFDTSKVTNMSKMFFSSKATTIDVNGINTSNVTDMSNMFSSSQASSLDLSSFVTSKVVDMSNMFDGSQATSINLSSFNTSKVANMDGMFKFSQATTLDLRGFDTSNVTNMSNMFSNSQAVILDVSSFDTGKVTNMSYMFENSKATTLDLSSFNTSNVTNMRNMFAEYTGKILDLSNFNTSRVTNMTSMFQGCKANNINLDKFDTSNVTNMTYMFLRSNVDKLDLSSFDTSNVTNMYGMFMDSINLKTIYISNKFVTNNVMDSTGMFHGATALEGGNGTKYSSSHKDKTYARIDTPSTPGYFTLKQ